jgi:hypothetical protein
VIVRAIYHTTGPEYLYLAAGVRLTIVLNFSRVVCPGRRLLGVVYAPFLNELAAATLRLGYPLISKAR